MKKSQSGVRFNRLIMHFNNIHLREKLLICYGALIIFSIAMVGIFSYYNIRNYIYKQTSESYIQTMEQMNLNIESRLNIYSELLEHIISDKGFIYALTAEYDSPADFSFQYLDQIMKISDYKEKYKNILDIVVYKNNSTLPEDGENLQDIENLRGIWWFDKYFKNYKSDDINEILKIADSNIWIVTDENVVPQFIRENGSTVKQPVKKIAIIKPIVINSSKVAGLVEIYIDYNSIFGELVIDKTESREKEIIILDKNMNLVFDCSSAPNHKFQLKSEYVNGLQNEDKGSLFYNKGSSNVLLVYERGRYSNWMYYLEIPMSQLMSGVKTIGTVTVFIAIISIIVSIIIGTIIAGLISSRISTLSKRMDEVEDLSLDVEVRFGGKDEIGNLARSFNRMIRKIQELVSELHDSHQLRREAELKAMQSQINPHFLYNTLATINWMVMDGEKKKITSMINNLATFYRLSLNKGKEFLKIADEINHVKAYGDIQKVRLEEKINLYYYIDEEILECYTMKLILQPFVENAILHGAEVKKNGTTNIVIRGFRQGDNIVLNVIDDGGGMANVPTPESYPITVGYGIRNVHEKIQLQYGKQYGVQLFSSLGIGTKAEIVIPAVWNSSEK